MSILSLAPQRMRRIALRYTDKEISMSPLMSYIDELISEKAERTIDGWSLHAADLAYDELRHIRKLSQYLCSIQKIIDERCDERYHYWRDTRGFDE